MAEAVLPIILTLFTILTAVHPGSTGEPCKTVTVDNVRKYCCDVTCPPGKQPVCSQDEAPTTECEDCPGVMFSDIPTTPYRRCQRKKKCSTGNNMIFLDSGSTTKNAICGCKEGYKYTNADKCDPAVTNSPDEDVPPSADIKLIAIIVGSAVFLIFIIVCVSCWCRKHRGRSEAEDETDHTPDTELALIDPLDKALKKALKNVITQIKVDLIEDLDDIDYAQLALYEKEEVINKRTSSEIKSKSIQQEKVDKLMEHISNSPIDRFKGFCKVMGENRQTNIISLVNKAIEKTSCSEDVKAHLRVHYIIRTEKSLR